MKILGRFVFCLCLIPLFMVLLVSQILAVFFILFILLPLNWIIVGEFPSSNLVDFVLQGKVCSVPIGWFLDKLSK